MYLWVVYIFLFKKVFLLLTNFPSFMESILGFNIIFTRASQPANILSMYDIINAHFLEGGFYFERKATFVTRS
jgi:hypothetical protein